MCYSFTPVQDPSGAITWLPRKVLDQLLKEGRIQAPEEVFPGDRANIFRWTDLGVAPAGMRFDLVPRFYLRKEDLPLEAMLKRKRSRKQGGDGFSSYNARSESLLERPAFRGPWLESKRMIVPVSAFRERPNMDGAPEEFRGRDFRILSSGPMILAGIWDAWRNREGENLESFSIITVDSAGNPLLRSIWHERCPLILDPDQVGKWLNPETSPEEAMKMIRLHPSEGMRLEEIAPPAPGKKPGEAQQTSLF
ncbi:MAG: SOS response-associated peptidase family protein [Fibrobacteres bacterium]|nr:SOS response-associated peptidase family protein [Fibrobacterota bacterium]